jgi:inosine-uridine nucleoside N-ribohydrolase
MPENTVVRKIIIDTDPGVDDAMAIFYALLSPEIELMALTTVFGNHETAVCTRNALNILDIAGRGDIPVAQGAERPLAQDYHGAADFVHGADGLGNMHLSDPERQPDPRHAVEFLRDTLLASEGDITLMPIGPLTNIALLALQYPSAMAKVKEIVLMGGNAYCAGNASPAGEANIWNDSEAADVVFSLGVPVTMIGLDVTHKVWMNSAQLDSIATFDNPMAQFVARILGAYRAFHEKTWGEDGIHVHDSTALSYLLHPEWFETVQEPVRVITEGLARGKTMPAPKQSGNALSWQNRPLVTIALEVNAEACIQHELELLKRG